MSGIITCHCGSEEFYFDGYLEEENKVDKADNGDHLVYQCSKCGKDFKICIIPSKK